LLRLAFLVTEKQKIDQDFEKPQNYWSIFFNNKIKNMSKFNTTTKKQKTLTENLAGGQAYTQSLVIAFDSAPTDGKLNMVGSYV